MKKVAELAEELKVSRQTVYNWIKKLSPEIDSYISKEEGAKVIQEEGIEMIRQAVGADQEEKNLNFELQLLKQENDFLNQQVEFLQEQINDLKEQLNRKDQLLMLQQRTLQQKKIEGESKGLVKRIKNFFKGEE